MNEIEIQSGRIVGQRYELVRLLGRGSMGEVWVGRHQSLHEDVAVKIMARPGDVEKDEPQWGLAARFRFEAHIAARLSRLTRHIVRVTDYGEEPDGLAYLVMELLEGETLENLLAKRGPMRAADVASLVDQIARALERAHSEGVVHRDLKPANVFVTRDEEGGMLVKLLDFGIARAIRTQRVGGFATGDGLLCGTPGYMSPEQVCASRVDPQCDLWALATTAYEAMTGKLPIAGSSPEEVFANLRARSFVPVHACMPDLPAGLTDFFDRAFAPQVELRFASARHLSLAFERAATGEPGGGTRLSAVLALRGADDVPHGEEALRAAGPARRHLRLALKGSAACLGALGLAVAASFPRVHALEETSPADASAGPSKLESTFAPPPRLLETLAPEEKREWEDSPVVVSRDRPLVVAPSRAAAPAHPASDVHASPKAAPAPASPQDAKPLDPSSIL